MSATVSAWGKPGAWALEAEEQDAADAALAHSSHQPAAAAAAEPAEFPSLAAAAASKASKKKKKFSLAEFTTGHAVTQGSGKFRPSAASEPKGLTTNEILSLPTGPRERTAEELERSSYRGFNNYGGGAGRYGGAGGGDGEPRRGGFGDREGGREEGGGFNKDSGPSRADEADDWGSTKRSVAPMERRESGGGFFESHSRADDSDTWISKRSPPPPSSDNRRMGEGFRERRGGFDFHRDGPGPDADTWGRRREEPSGFDGAGAGAGGGARPRLVLQPRSVPPENGNGVEQTTAAGSKTKASNPFGAARPREEVLLEKGQNPKEIDEKMEPVKSQEDNNVEPPVIVPKSKSSNPFGAARPREEVLAAKGQDWKEIDEKLEAMKVREPKPLSRDGPGFRGAPNRSDERAERKWRKDDSAAQSPSPPPSVVKGDDEVVSAN